MKKDRFIFRVIKAIQDPERELRERVYLALTLVCEVTIFIALIGDIITKENPLEIWFIVATLIFTLAIMVICFRRKKLGLAIKLTIAGMVFFILPAIYFFGGGIRGGGFLWIIFTYTYAGLVLTGALRIAMFVGITLMASAFFIIEYFYPQLVYQHSKEMFFVDSFISLFLVGVVCFSMTWIQNSLYIGENKRAKDAAKKAEDLSRAQNRFFSSMSHEIRTPINAILGLNELILRDHSASDEVIREASGIQGSGKMLLTLIDDILDFSKVEAGSMELVPVNYDVGEMFSEIVNMFWGRANDKGLKFNVIIDPKLPSVLYGDEVRIKQILVNLINNAIKYTSEGSVDLRVESEIREGDMVDITMSVSDTGMGIKKEALPFIFDVFKRVDENKNRHIEGTGLGLSIVKHLTDLMGGTVSVNSIYGEGSTFTVSFSQEIADSTAIGELNIHNESASKRKTYENLFHAPEAKVLIVDDNEINLEVECKLLEGTQMLIHGAMSGKEALEMCLKEKYDAILMDHIMPEMDGIECLSNIRNQEGGLNRSTPIVVLTANAGSVDRETYYRAGFDGYLVKPVSSESLESTLMRYIVPDKLIVRKSNMVVDKADINASAGYSGKMPLLITSTSMCDLPEVLTSSFIPVLPFLIKTEEGVFKDGVQMSADELVRYMSTGKQAESLPPDEAAYRDFFAMNLKQAHHIIHIAISTGMSEDYKLACEAARSFDNVTVINSEVVSSATGILVLIAIKLAQMNASVEEIVSELEEVKKRLRCSFIIDDTESMARKGFIRPEFDQIARSLSLHPCLTVRDDALRIGGIWLGSTQRVYRKYINKAFPVDVIPDPEVVFVTYVNVPIETLRWIKEEISKKAYFENVVFKQASAAISSNCGPGTFGIIYFVKSNKSYNLNSYFNESMRLFRDEQEDYDAEDEEEVKEPLKWYEAIEGIDGKLAIKNNGSEEGFRKILKFFYDSIDSKAEELDRYYYEEDYSNYVIKVHALKSSCRLIGALGISEKAQLLENAGKEERYDYIKQNHSVFIREYRSYKDALSELFEEDTPADEEKEPKPVADKLLMESVYEGLRDGADAMDCDAIDAVFKEVEGYAIPENEAEKFSALRMMADQFDYEGMLEILNGNGNSDK